MAPGTGLVLPIHPTTESTFHQHKSKSKRTTEISSYNSRFSEVSRISNHTSKLSTSLVSGTSSTHTSRPGLYSRTSSTPLISSSRRNYHRPEELDDHQTDAYSLRDSVASIKDDPFFRNYQSPESVSLARELKSASDSTNAVNSELFGERYVGLSKDSIASGSAGPTSYLGMDNINVAVIGAAGVGKSTLIQRALSLRSLPTGIVSSLKMSVNDVAYTVCLVEFDLECFESGPDRQVQWPKQINGQLIPRIDGALILYDVMNRESILELPQTLNALVYSSLPTILVSCKCDNPTNTRQIDTESIQAACLAKVETLKTAANVPESARICLGAMLHAVVSSRNGAFPEPTVPRQRAASSTLLVGSSNGLNTRSSSPQNRHSRASSDYSLLKGFPSPPPSARSQNSQTRKDLAGPLGIHEQYKISAPHIAPSFSSRPAFRNDTARSTSSSDTESLPREELKPTIDDKISSKPRGLDSFLDMDESDADSSHPNSHGMPVLEQEFDSNGDQPAKVVGFAFDELVDRLLSHHMSKADSNFLDIFLCLYRKFAAPGELFSAVISRLEEVGDDTGMHYLTQTAAQLRIITVVAKWIESYPGDFASLQTTRRLEAFIDQLSLVPAFSATAHEMSTNLLLHVVEDDDTGWARTDADMDSDPSQPGDLLALQATRSRTKPRSELANMTRNFSPTDKMRERRPSEAVSVSSADPVSPPEFRTSVFHTVEDYEMEAATLVPTSTMPLTKFRFRICMGISDEDFADEITRIDWVMFSSIRIRDLVRHVSLSLDQKERCKSLSNVNRMISHFNHIARWVANMILMRDKSKHRAQMLEKFMRIAVRLRERNNYNGLAAIIAGINGSAVHRLAQTRALVPVDCQKRFMRLELLMGTQKSHFAYRLAWENSSLPRIPFIPLHRRDLVSAEEGSRTFIGPAGDRINWKKFEVLAEVLLPIMRSQGTPYVNLERHDAARELILDCRMPTDEEEIYQLSLQLESSTSTLDAGKKKFPWFQK